MKKLLSVLTVAALTLSMLVGCGGNTAPSEENGDPAGVSAGTVEIGVIQYTAHPALDASRDGFIAKLEELGYKDGENCTSG